GALNKIAWAIVNPDAPELERRGFSLAIKAGTRANELRGGKEPGVLDTLALVDFVFGGVAKAGEVQQKAIRLAEDQGMKHELAPRREKYKKAQAAAKQKG